MGLDAIWQPVDALETLFAAASGYGCESYQARLQRDEGTTRAVSNVDYSRRFLEKGE